ncbi:MAG: hypothetical protein R3272_15850, partial [Candidatus Promineifilaceae bacterium]|nr:hypothetical protein [Candidatus Promineifilaceae bacterium]
MFRFVQRRRYYFIFSGILISLGILAMLISTIQIGSPFRIGVDFQSGTRFEVQFQEPTDEQEIRAVLADLGLANPAITSLQGEALENAWQIRTEYMEPEEANVVEAALAEGVAPLNPDATLVETVSPSVGAEVTRAAFVAVIVSAVIVLGYIMFAFRQVPNPFR